MCFKNLSMVRNAQKNRIFILNDKQKQAHKIQNAEKN